MTGLLWLAAALVAIALHLPVSWWDSASPDFLFAIGVVALWRYGWGTTHLVRAVIYKSLVFPAIRRRADAASQVAMPSHLYLLVTSFRIGTDTSIRVFSAAIAEAVNCDRPTTLVASVVEEADSHLVRTLFRLAQPPPRVRLVVVKVAGSGKRNGIAHALRAIAAQQRDDYEVVCLVDGDTILPRGTLKRCLPVLMSDRSADALTTDEVCEVEGRGLIRDWYNLRFAQRQVLMCSVGLSRRVLTLTGRFSAIRAGVACSEAFIQRVEGDSIDHWRLGRVPFLTGDDKSTWFHILKSGRSMLYVPDVRVVTVETPPDPSFWRSATVLMRRWFGNMLRTNGRAIALGPGPMGFFAWWCLVDQRLAMWTSLIGPVAAVALTLSVTPLALPAYLFWVMLTRLIQILALSAFCDRLAATWPALLFFNQLRGATIKIGALFRMDQQRWTRQGIAAGVNGVWLGAQTSLALHTASILLFISVVSVLVGAWGTASPAPSGEVP